MTFNEGNFSLTSFKKLTNKANQFFSHDQVKDQSQEVDALFSYFNRTLSPSKGLSVVVDDSQQGHDAFIHIIQKCSENGREIFGHYILKDKATEDSLLALNLYKSNSLFSGVEHSTFKLMINMIERMSLISIHEKLRILATKRAATGLAETCCKPTYLYFMADYHSSPSIVTYIIEKVNGCVTSSEGSDNAMCFARFVAF